MSDPISALSGAATGAGHYISIVDRGPVAQVTLKADLADPAVGAALKSVLGLAVPARLAFSRTDGAVAVWMAPDEALILPGQGSAAEVAAALDAALAGQHAMALDVSDARTVFRLTGARVAEVLAKGLPVDLSASAFPVGTARRTHLGEVAVGLWRLSEDEWELVCFRSYAPFTFEFLATASVSGSEVGWF